MGLAIAAPPVPFPGKRVTCVIKGRFFLLDLREKLIRKPTDDAWGELEAALCGSTTEIIAFTFLCHE